MIEQLFTNLSLALNGSFLLAVSAAFGWGVISILLSPCHLSSIPLVVGYISNQGNIKVKDSFKISLVFAVGILITVAALGIITAAMGRIMGDVGRWGNVFVAGIFIGIGLYLMDVLRWDWNKVSVGDNPRNGLWGAFILGLVFGVGLGPCTFAFLAPVLGVVFKTATEDLLKGLLLILAFGIGNSLIIVIAGSFTKLVQQYLNWTISSKATLYIKRISGFFVILGGIYFIYNF